VLKKLKLKRSQLVGNPVDDHGAQFAAFDGRLTVRPGVFYLQADDGREINDEEAQVLTPSVGRALEQFSASHDASVDIRWDDNAVGSMDVVGLHEIIGTAKPDVVCGLKNLVQLGEWELPENEYMAVLHASAMCEEHEETNEDRADCEPAFVGAETYKDFRTIRGWVRL